VSYFEATCEQLDVERKVALFQSVPAFEDGRRPQFEVPYDLAVVAVGELPATFGVPGVAQHCYFMKEVEDTVALRRRISECFELASLPGTTQEERAQLLHFVVVGGGRLGGGPGRRPVVWCGMGGCWPECRARPPALAAAAGGCRRCCWPPHRCPQS
jgi:hypothetical protein